MCVFYSFGLVTFFTLTFLALFLPFLVPQCNQVITSDAGRNGSFSSPNYPHYYTAKTQCRYDFIGHGKERVQILFTDFSLYHPDETEQDQTINLDKSRGGSGFTGDGQLSPVPTNPYHSYYFSLPGFTRNNIAGYAHHPNLNWNRVNEKTTKRQEYYFTDSQTTPKSTKRLYLLLIIILYYD